MNTTTTASLCRTRPIALFLVTLLAALTGCAAPIAGLSTPAPTFEPELAATHLTVHAPAETTQTPLPTPRAAETWLEELAPVKAKEATPATADTEAQEEEQPVQAKRDCPLEGERVLLIGDSLSAGLGPHMAKRARACNTVFFVHGVVGSHVTEWTQPSWLKGQLKRAKPTVVIVSLGGNDFVRNDGERVERAIQSFVSTVRDSGAELRWISPPSMPFPDKVGARDMWQTAIDGEQGKDWYPTEDLELIRTSDRVHPTISEYDRLAGILWTWMANS